MVVLGVIGLHLDTIILFTANNINNFIMGATDASFPLWDHRPAGSRLPTGSGIETSWDLVLPPAWCNGVNGKD